MKRNNSSNVNTSTTDNGRSTHVRYTVIDAIAQSFVMGERDIPYTRSIDKAATAVRNALIEAGAIEDTPTVIIAISSLENTKAERRAYNITDVVNFADGIFDDENIAREKLGNLDVAASVKTVVQWQYTVPVWAQFTDSETGMIIDRVIKASWASYERYSAKADYTAGATAFAKTYASEAVQHGDENHVVNFDRIVFVDMERAARKHETLYAVITDGNLAKCRYTVYTPKNDNDNDNDTDK